MFEYLMYIFEDQMCIFGYLKIPDIILSLVSSQKLDWTQTFGTYCIFFDITVWLNHLQLIRQRRQEGAKKGAARNAEKNKLVFSVVIYSTHKYI